MSQFDGIVAQDRDEYRSAVRYDTARYRRIGGQLHDADQTPDPADVLHDHDDWSDQ